jgi:hypothetical protein
VRFDGATTEDGDRRTATIIARVQREGTCWVGPTVYLGRTAMRVSISNWSTTEMDVDRSIAAIATIGRQCS